MTRNMRGDRASVRVARMVGSSVRRKPIPWRTAIPRSSMKARIWLVSQRTGIINQIRAFMLERGIAVRQGIGFLRTELPTILATRTDALSPRMLRVIEELAGDWRRIARGE